MKSDTQIEKAQYFHELHHSLFVMPNAWDALSAKLFEMSGARAIGTTSAGLAAVFGYSDGEKIPLKLFFAMLEKIISVVKCPVTVDIESGMGEKLNKICDNVRRIISYGAVGINIEDSQASHLISPHQQVIKIEAIKSCSEKIGVPLFVNARIDTYWLNVSSDLSTIYSETLSRAKLYKNAGADGIFVPGLTDLSTIRRLIKDIALPINILANKELPNTKQLNDIGVARVSMGSSLVRSVSSFINEMSVEYLRTGKFPNLEKNISYPIFNTLFNGS